MELGLVAKSLPGYGFSDILSLAQRKSYAYLDLPDVDDNRIQHLATQCREAHIIPFSFERAIVLDREGEGMRLQLNHLRLLDILGGAGIRYWRTKAIFPGSTGGISGWESDYSIAAEYLCLLDREAAQRSVVLTLITDADTIHGNPEGLRRLLKRCRSSSIKTCLDLGSLFVVSPTEDIGTMIKDFRRDISSIHIRNVSLNPWGADWSVPIRCGHIDYRRLLIKIRGIYDGPLSIEYSGVGDPVWILEDAADYIRSLITEMP